MLGVSAHGLEGSLGPWPLCLGFLPGSFACSTIWLGTEEDGLMEAE